MDLNTYTLPQLKKLQARITVEIGRRSVERKKSLLKEVEKLAKASGLDLSDLMPAAPQVSKTGKTGTRTLKHMSAPKKVYGKLPIKYWNPENPDQGWSGHARKPAWVAEWLAKGRSLDELTVRRKAGEVVEPAQERFEAQDEGDTAQAA